MRYALSVAIAAAALGAPGAADAAAGGGPTGPVAPTVRWTWTMPDGIQDKRTWVPVNDPAQPGYAAGGRSDRGPDTVPDGPPRSLKRYRQAGRAVFGPLARDGRFRVLLDASRSTGAGRLTCTWRIEADRTYRRRGDCRTRLPVRLPEGDHTLRLTVSDRDGSTAIAGTITVTNHLLALLGDSYAAGVGTVPFTELDSDGKRRLVWDDPGCGRSRWSGAVRAATRLEAADPRSNVTLVNVACGGAVISGPDTDTVIPGRGTGGMLHPQRTGTGYRPAQIDQVNAIVRGRPVDAAYFLIGGNDVAFGPIAQACFASGADRNCYAEPPPWASGALAGRPLYDIIDEQLTAVADRYANLAKCFSPSRGRGRCRTTPVLAGQPGPRPTRSDPVRVRDAADVVQGTYPDLTTDTDPATGAVRPCSWSFDYPLTRTSSSWAWRGAYRARAGQEVSVPAFAGEPAPDPASYTARGNGLTTMIRDNGRRYGWTIAGRMVRESRGRGACAGPTAWVNSTRASAGLPPFDDPVNPSAALHPSNAGQRAYSRTFARPLSRRLGVPVG